MKKICSLFLAFVLAISMISAACAAGYTLPEKMERQLQVGSGLKGSFAIYANADPELNPFLHSVQNAAFEIRGIQYEGNQHLYIYQAGADEKLDALTEYCKIDNQEYLRSDFLDEGCFLLPKADSLINKWLKSEGETPSIFPDLLRMLLSSSTESKLETGELERQIEMMISAFSAEPSIQSGDGSPRLNQTFRIPLAEVYSTVTELVQIISSNESYMSYFRELLTQEQIDTYLNPNLGYYYVDAMNQLDMEGDIVFSRTVSTLGDLIQSSLVLPMDDEKTGYSSVRIQSSETRKSIFFIGSRGMVYLELPVDFELNGEDFDNAEIRFAYVDHENEESDNLALKITASKDSEKYDNAEENRIHEKTAVILHISRETEGLPEEMTDEIIPDMAAANAEIMIHWSSKSQLSSPTTLEISCKIDQGRFAFDLEGTIKSSSPWSFTPFDTTNAVHTENYNKEDFDLLKETWVNNAEKKLVRIDEGSDNTLPAVESESSGNAS